MQEEVRGRLRRGRLGVRIHGFRVEGARIDVEPGARLQHVDDRDADHQGNRGHELEVQQRLAAHPPDFLHVARAGDAEDDGAEDDGRDQHLHERDEAIAQRLELHGVDRIEVPERPAGQDGEDDPEVEVAGKSFHARLSVEDRLYPTRDGPFQE